jgi:TAP-like protein
LVLGDVTYACDPEGAGQEHHSDTDLAGEYDPVTSPASGTLAAQMLRKSYFFLFPGVGHRVHSSTSTCPNEIIGTFLENPTEKPDAKCFQAIYAGK